MNQEEFVRRFCDSINACQHPRQVYTALRLLAESRRLNYLNHKEENGHDLERDFGGAAKGA